MKKSQAQAEHKRLNGSSSSSSTASKNIYEFPVVASFFDSNELYYGHIRTVNKGTGEIAVANKKTGVKCSGNAWVTSTPPHVLALQAKGEMVCEGQEGAGNLSCTDGRKLRAKYHLEDCGSGWGTGEDNYGAKFHFVFGLSEEESVAWLENEEKKLDKKSTTAQTAQTTTTQPKVVDNMVELEFWQSIKGSDDPDMYREYLRQFPSGVYAGLAKLKIKKLGGDTTVVNASIPNLDYGDYYALVIGNNEYPGLSNLRSAVGDARAVSNVLEVDYGFKVERLENATRSQILRSIAGLRRKVSAKDNILIYYAGHGYLDEAADEGYWLPVDADRSDQSNWIITDRIVSQVKAMQAKHVMVVADSCFSGTITRAIKIEQRTPDYLQKIVRSKSRTALTSGGLEPVLDSGGGHYSVFARSFISLLEENQGVIDGSQLFSKLRPKVMVNSTQIPQYGNIHQAGHDGGDFLFVRR